MMLMLIADINDVGVGDVVDVVGAWRGREVVWLLLGSRSLLARSCSATMDALALYGSDDDDNTSTSTSTSTSSTSSDTLASEHPAKKMRIGINLAPEVDTTRHEATSVVLHDASKDKLYYNPRYEQFAQAAEGPLPANQANMKVSKSGLSTLPNANCWTGYIEDYNVHRFAARARTQGGHHACTID